MDRHMRADPNEPESDDERRLRLNERLRAAFVEGAERKSQRRLGRGLTREDGHRYAPTKWTTEGAARGDNQGIRL